VKTCDPALTAHLNANNKFIMADLYTITGLDGTVMRLTTWDVDLKVGANTFLASGPYVARGRTSLTLGLETAELEMAVRASISHLYGTIPFIQAARLGLLNKASVVLERLFMPTPGDTSIPPLLHFAGLISRPLISTIEVSFTVRADTSQLNEKCPKNVMQPACRHLVFDPGCTLDRNVFKKTSSVSGGSTKSKILCGLVDANAWFDLGYVQFTSGPNAGVKRTVRQYIVGEFNFHLPLFFDPVAGNTFDAFPGCDNRMTTCDTKFSNLVNFAGHPFIPKAEAAI
jgi:hypothetical protein